MGFAPTWLRQMSPLLHKTTLTTGSRQQLEKIKVADVQFMSPNLRPLLSVRNLGVSFLTVD